MVLLDSTVHFTNTYQYEVRSWAVLLLAIVLYSINLKLIAFSYCAQIPLHFHHLL